MARYHGLPRVTKEIKEKYESFLSYAHGYNDIIPMNVISYDDGSLALTVTVHDCIDPPEAMIRVKEILSEREVPYTDIEHGPVDIDTTYIFIHHFN